MDDEGYYASDGDHHVNIGIMVKVSSGAASFGCVADLV